MIELVTGEVGIKKLDVGDDLLVYWNSGEHSRFSFIWLRDNARDEACFYSRIGPGNRSGFDQAS